MLYFILAIILLAISTFYRVIKGPSIADRIMAMNTIGVMFLLVLVLLSFYFERKIFIDVALVYGVFLFVNVLILDKYFSKPIKEKVGD
ncbi:putative monovalent cation/H+ antiporter subunit F [Paraliobacillus sp. PM-2]|uniref:monovalent cation/H+ antiporter complex subunit F n=1 Tax=Paraliobacillus sp. PM-2 TaxID=1462524 RepID=UPI00061C9F94|nr:monovalent cation/H+ antiporter complex subunit F [Paraliobacillus sp. PM-2]CQR48035.1 putative monovalent cation/H+ antiporter subunit F [Paraliobacillus sp. PM-2]